MNSFETKGSRTIEVFFYKPFPDQFNIELNGELYFFRRLGGKYASIKFNVCSPGFYETDINCSDIIIKPISIEPLNIKLPPIERNRLKEFRIIFNPDLKGTPACNYTKDGVIEYGWKFKSYPYPIKLFILCHEYAHFYYGKGELTENEVNRKLKQGMTHAQIESEHRKGIYESEKYCDALAAKIFVDNGYNPSTAFYALTQVLNTGSEYNNERINALFKQLQNKK